MLREPNVKNYVEFLQLAIKTLMAYRNRQDSFTPIPHRGVHACQSQRRDKVDLLLKNDSGNRKGLGGVQKAIRLLH